MLIVIGGTSHDDVVVVPTPEQVLDVGPGEPEDSEACLEGQFVVHGVASWFYASNPYPAWIQYQSSEES